MSPRARKTAAVVTSAVLVGGGGVAAAAAAAGHATKRAQDQVPYGAGYGAPGPGRGPAGPHGPGRGGLPPEALAGVAKTLGVSTDQLQSALDAARPAPPDTPPGDHPKGDIASELAGALNVDAAKVESILDANRPAPPAAPPAPGNGYGPGPAPARHPERGRPGFDDSALVSALAKGLSIDESTVKAAFEKIAAAHEADHAAHETAFFAAIAKSLGLDASAVQKAFEAARPPKPAPGG